MTNTDTNTLQGQRQSQASKQSYFEKEHNDNDNYKYQYNFYNSCRSNKDICNLRYEDLRKKAMTMELKGKKANTNTPGIQELSIFIQRGMIDWVEVWNRGQLQYPLNEMTNRKKIKTLVYNENDNDSQLDRDRDRDRDRDTDTARDYAGINLPLNLQAQVKNLLVQIVMNTLPNKMSAKHITQQ